MPDFADGTVRFRAVGDPAEVTDGPVGNVRTPRPIGPPVPASIGSINALSFAPGQTWLAAVGGAGKAVLWDVAGLLDLRTHVVEQACARTGRGLTPSEWAALTEGLAYQDTCAPG